MTKEEFASKIIENLDEIARDYDPWEMGLSSTDGQLKIMSDRIINILEEYESKH